MRKVEVGIRIGDKGLSSSGTTRSMRWSPMDGSWGRSAVATRLWRACRTTKAKRCSPSRARTSSWCSTSPS